MSGILNLPGLRKLDKKESETEYHVKAEPAAIARLCPHCPENRHQKSPICRGFRGFVVQKWYAH